MCDRPIVHSLFDPATSSIQYLVADEANRKAVIVDPVLDFDERSGRITTRNADALLSMVRDHNYELELIVDTHPHADHFSAATYLRERSDAKIATGARVADVRALWSQIYNWPDNATDLDCWDKLFFDGDEFNVGAIPAKIIYSPGHTLASITLVVGDAAFIHDTLFMPDGGTARCDFPGGSAKSLWNSIQRILSMPDATRLFTGHDYQPGGREIRWQSTVSEQRNYNIHLNEYRNEERFVAARNARDATLPLPRLMLAALQMNLNAGRLPRPESNGRSYLKIPVNQF